MRRDRDLAEDIVQETWLRAVKSWRADGVPERPMAWLTAVASRLLSNYFRRRPNDRIDDGAGDKVQAPDADLQRDTFGEGTRARAPAAGASAEGVRSAVRI